MSIVPDSTHRKKQLTVWLMLDKTGSMHRFGAACKNAFPEILSLISILGCGKANVRFIAYGDYDTPNNVVEISGPDAQAEELLNNVHIDGGGDFPEAVKTAYFRLLRSIKDEDIVDSDTVEREHLVFLFTDAPPHYSLDGPLQSTRGHFNAESAALGKNFDWLHLCRCATSRRVSTVTFIPYTAKDACAPFYSLLGPLVVLQDTVPAQISSAIMSTFLQMMHEDPPAPVAITRGILTPSKKNESRWQAHMASIQRGVMLTSADPILEKLSEEASVDELRAAAPQVAHVLSATLPKLPALLKKDAELRAVAVRNLKRLATPQRVRAMMTNAALGKVWRAVAAFRRHDEQVAILCDAFSAAVQGDAEMHAWVESTYNMQDEIDELFNACTADERFIMHAPESAPAFPLPTLRQTLDLLRGSFTAEVAGGVLEALRNVTVVSTPRQILPADDCELPTDTCTKGMLEDNGASWEAEHGIPADLPNKSLFAALMHLMHAGTLASVRSAAMIAVFALVAAPKPLSERARQWLSSPCMRGRWTGAHDWDTYPEVFSVQFMLLMRKPEVREMLTQDEQYFFDRVWYLWRLQRTRQCMLRVRTAAQGGKKPEIRPDYRHACKKCKASRPLSLLVKGKCVFCMSDDPAEAAVKVPECSAEGKSHMAQCRSKSCRAFYAVERPELLLCEPKCHYCREGDAVPTITCSVCHAQHVVPDAATMNKSVAAKWVCAPCNAEASGDSSITQQVPISAMLLENPSMLRALEYAVPADAFTVKLCAAFRNWGDVILPQAPEEGVMGLTYKGAAVLNCPQVCLEFRDSVRTADIADLCTLCWASKPLTALASACGSCDMKICDDCRKRWYEITPGTLPVAPARLCCPFCKRAPKPRAAFCGRRNLPREILIEEAMVHGFCRVCRAIQGAVARECVGPAGGEIPEVRDWACIDCREVEAQRAAEAAQHAAHLEQENRHAAEEFDAEERRIARGAAAARGVPRAGGAGRVESVDGVRGVRLCPGCGFGTLKSTGCNHMTCVVCEAHWCWECGQEFSAETIYEHLEEECGLGI